MRRSAAAWVVQVVLHFSVFGSAADLDCSFKFPRTQAVAPSLDAPRIVPAVVPGGGELLVAWQDTDSIFLRWYGRDCQHHTQPVEVNTTAGFIRSPGGGLWDVAGLGGGRRAVVAWVLAGDVWVRVVDASGAGGRDSPPIRANQDAGRYSRTEVRVVRSPDADGGFVVAWSSYEQDGDGWGVFARRFSADARPMDAELLVNLNWRQNQWQPQLAWCGSHLWALWANSSSGGGGSACGAGGQCKSGPLLRHLAVVGNGTWSLGHEINLKGDDPLAAALACGEGNNAVVLWLYNGGEEVEWKYFDPSHASSMDAPTQEALSLRRLSQTIGGWRSLEPPTSAGAALAVATALIAALSATLAAAVAKFAAVVPWAWWADEPQQRLALHHHGLRSVWHAARAERMPPVVADSQDPLEAGQVNMIASTGLLVVLSVDGRGTLSAQLLDYGRRPRPVAYPERQVASGAHAVRAAWDIAGEGDSAVTSMVFCWVTSGGIVDGGGDGISAGSFQCVWKSATWLVGPGGIELTGSLAAILLFCIVGGFIWLRQCVRNGCFSGRRQFLNRRTAAGGVTGFGRPSRAANQARIRELRAQLEAIPTIPQQGSSEMVTQPPEDPASPPSASAPTAAAVGPEAEGGEGASHARPQSCGADAAVCAICQNEVAVRVALQTCGHTACRDCVLRLVEMNQRCHICRGPIEGVLPVYI